ncbi:MAG: hypothetical protein LT067_02215 [Sulfurovum sp.]|nr:hypothetical protein [Sulfurovum sp.]
MNILNNAKTSLNHKIEKLARNNIIRKLEKQGIDYNDLSAADLHGLIADEIKILENDTKKVGLGIGIGLAISMLTGF